jgi:hypothetical protein
LPKKIIFAREQARIFAGNSLFFGDRPIISLIRVYSRLSAGKNYEREL